VKCEDAKIRKLGLLSPKTPNLTLGLSNIKVCCFITIEHPIQYVETLGKRFCRFARTNDLPHNLQRVHNILGSVRLAQARFAICLGQASVI
jgi:hypothetical protein